MGVNEKYKKLIICSPCDSFTGGGSLLTIGKQQAKFQVKQIKRIIGSGDKATIIAGCDGYLKETCGIMGSDLQIQGMWIDSMFSDCETRKDLSEGDILSAKEQVLWFIKGNARKIFILLPGKKLISPLVREIIGGLSCIEPTKQTNLFGSAMTDKLPSPNNGSLSGGISKSVEQGGIVTVVELGVKIITGTGDGAKEETVNTFYIPGL
jgi:hypothetical protein